MWDVLQRVSLISFVVSRVVPYSAVGMRRTQFSALRRVLAPDFSPSWSRTAIHSDVRRRC
jgi:hypothetical protein